MRAVRNRRRWMVGIGSGAVLTAALIQPTLAASNARPAHLPRAGCEAGRTARAYGPAGQPLPVQPAPAPIPCLVATGFPTIETHVAVTNDGTVVYEPALDTSGPLGASVGPGVGAPGPHPWTDFTTGDLAISPNQGATWNFDKPAGGTYAGNDNALYVDPTTGRIFLGWEGNGGPVADSTISPANRTVVGQMIFTVSADDGKTWQASELTGFEFSENSRFTSAPPPAGGTLTAGGYPDVTYWCGNMNVGVVWPGPTNRQCFSSLNGGSTWQFRSILFASLVPATPECSTPPYFFALDGNYPQGASDGSLYVIVACANPGASSLFGPVYLARSTDEASTWPVLQQPTSATSTSPYVQLPVPTGATDPELRVTEVNGQTVLVLAYQTTVSGSPEVVVRSADVPPYTAGGALSRPLVWSDPTLLAPLGLSSIDRWAVTVRGAELSLSFIAGSATSSGTVWNAYIATMNQLTTPVIWTATVNDPSVPQSHSAPAAARDDFIGVAIGPDGTPWASYFFPCNDDPKAPTDPACAGDYFEGQNVTPSSDNFLGGTDRGMVGSLLLPGTK